MGEVPISSTELTRQLSQPGRGSGVEGFTSGRPYLRPAMQAATNMISSYKYFSHTPTLLYPMKRRELAATFLKDIAFDALPVASSTA